MGNDNNKTKHQFAISVNNVLPVDGSDIRSTQIMLVMNYTQLKPTN